MHNSIRLINNSRCRADNSKSRNRLTNHWSMTPRMEVDDRTTRLRREPRLLAEGWASMTCLPRCLAGLLGTWDWPQYMGLCRRAAGDLSSQGCLWGAATWWSLPEEKKYTSWRVEMNEADSFLWWDMADIKAQLQRRNSYTIWQK